MNYPTVTLREICEAVQYGFTASASRERTGPHFLRITDIVPERLDWSSVPFCEISATDFSKYEIKEGDIVIARTGATTGYAKYIKRPPKAVFASYLVRVRLQSDVDARFIGFILESQFYKDFIKQHLSGAAQPNANAQILTSFPLTLPSLSEQRRIAGILSAYDELIENNQKRIKILEEMARSLYREWFVNFRFPGHESVRLVPSPLGNIPEGWEVKRLGDIADEMRRNVPKGRLNGSLPYVGLEHIPRQSLALDQWETATNLGSNKLAFEKGEVLFGKIRPYFHKVSVAPFDGLCSADTIVIRARKPEHQAFVTATVSSDEFVAHASATANGAKMPRANWNVLTDYQVAIPSSSTLNSFSSFYESTLSQLQQAIFRCSNLATTRNLALSQLLPGTPGD